MPIDLGFKFKDEDKVEGNKFENNIVSDIKYKGSANIGLENTFEEGNKLNLTDLKFEVPQINKWRFKTNKISIDDKGITKNTTEDIHELLVKYRSGDMYVHNLSSTEALKNEVEHFLNCIDERKISSINNLNLGCEVVNILEKTNISLNKKQVSI